ncbi:MAG: LXG domain-containing protein [Streptococcaceae bacterium]|jgi:hypothetical protein|nr:LXG domain-containing protein [Streptococcaceae bacterium]
MVVYDSGDSDLFIKAMTANLNSAKAVFNRLCRGSAHLIEVINSGVLSGAAYEAGKELFVTYINPMLQKLSQAITDIENDLNSYTTADYAVRQYENHLDEALLKKQLNATKELIRLLQQKIDDDQDLIKNLQSAANGDFKKIAENMAELPSLYEQLGNLEQVKSMYDQQIAALETFVSSTTPLFTDSLQAFKYAMQGVDIINQSRANFDGQIAFPAGADMSWSSHLTGEKFSSKLEEPKEQKNTKVKPKKNADWSWSGFFDNVDNVLSSSSKVARAFGNKIVVDAIRAGRSTALGSLIKDNAGILEDLSKIAAPVASVLSGVDTYDKDIKKGNSWYEAGAKAVFHGGLVFIGGSLGEGVGAAGGGALGTLLGAEGADATGIPEALGAAIGGGYGVVKGGVFGGNLADNIDGDDNNIVKGIEKWEKQQEIQNSSTSSKATQSYYNSYYSQLGTGEDMGGQIVRP